MTLTWKATKCRLRVSEHADGLNNFREHFIEHRSETTLTSPIWRQGEFFLAPFDWEHGPDVSEFHARRYHEPMVGEHEATTVLPDVPPSSCSEAQKCSPIS